VSGYRLTPPTAPFAASNGSDGEATAIHVPGSKSLTNRAVLLAALAEGETTLANVLFSDDTRRMLEALEALGFSLSVDEARSRVVVRGEGGRMPRASATLFLGNAGTAMRFLTAACCLGDGPYVLDGVERMRQRPIGQLVEALRQLGARIEYLKAEGYPPLRVHGGGLEGGEVRFPRAVSSQYVSALLQIGPYLPGGLRFHSETPLTSWPYVDMTVRLMSQFGAEFDEYDDAAASTIVVSDTHRYAGGRYTVEPDASSAGYFLAAAALMPGAQCRIDGLGFRCVQGDWLFSKAVLDRMGADVEAEDASVQVRGTSALRGIDRDLSDMPDMAQTLAVVALFAQGETTIRGIANLRVKETDRIEALRCELTRLGAQVTVHANDDMTITLPADGVLRHPDGTAISVDHPVVIETYDDHRMAMSFALAGLRQAGIVIGEPGCVNKTFPDYFKELAKLGVGVTAVEARA